MESAIALPPSAMLDTIGSSDEIIRDEHGNAVGGVRTVHNEAPLARFVAATPKGRPNWYWGNHPQSCRVFESIILTGIPRV